MGHRIEGTGRIPGIVQQDIKLYKSFVEAVARELYAVHPALVPRETILAIWGQHKRRWDD
jgi:hypothetical protein